MAKSTLLIPGSRSTPLPAFPKRVRRFAYRQRQSRAERQDAGSTPPTQQRMGQTRSSLADRHFVIVRADPVVPDIHRGRPPFGAAVAVILHLVRHVADRRSIKTGVVGHGMAPGERGSKFEPAREALASAQLEALVILLEDG